MKYAIRILSLAMVAVAIISMTACGGNIYEEVAATAKYNTESDGGNVVTVTNSNGDTVIVTDKNGGIVTQQNNKTTVNNGNGKTTQNQGGSQLQSTTRPTTTKPTTTKKPIVLNVPVGESAIIEAYNNAANKTKAQNNMTVDKTNDVNIDIDDLAGNSVITNLANSVASGFMKDYSGQTEREIYVNGQPTQDTKTKDKKTGKLAHEKDIFIPIMNKSYMSKLTTNDIEGATATKVSDSTYKVVIKIKPESTDLNTPPAMTNSGMDYFDQDVFDLQGFRFESGTVNYNNCVITAIINADGYVDYVEHKMSVGSTDAKVSIFGSEQDAQLHGDYVTTLKFYDIK